MDRTGSTMTTPSLGASTPPPKTTTFTIASPEELNDRQQSQENDPQEHHHQDGNEHHREFPNPDRNSHLQNHNDSFNRNIDSSTQHLSPGQHQHIQSVHIQNQDDQNGSGTSQESPQQSSLDRDERSSGEEPKDTEDAVAHESSTDLTFKKKDVSRSRTQSFQSVLSTASLKSLKQQVISNAVPPSASNRNNSIISTAPSNITNTKNFQSFIQAPVLSSISNLKNDDDIEIGQQLPFNDSKSHSGSDKSNNTHDESIASPVASADSYDDQDTIIQQQNLTLNALKKLSLSPMFIGNKDHSLKKLTRKPSQRRVESVSDKKTEPYQPAEVDLSSFASLTRQPKMNLSKPEKEEKPQPQSQPQQQPEPEAAADKEKLPRLEEENDLTRAQQEYHKELRNQQMSHIQKQQPQLTLQNPHSTNKIPAAVIPPHSMNIRRQSGHLPNQPSSSHAQSYLSNYQVPQPQNPSHQSQFKPHAQNLTQQPSNPPNHQQPHQVQHQQPHHIQQHQVSVSSPQTQNIAKVNKQLQQIKGLRSPMYVPAVLRLTLKGASPTNSHVSSNLNSNATTPGEVASSNVVHGIESTLQALQHQHHHQHDLEPSSSTSSIRSFDSGMSVDSTASSSLPSKTNYLGSSKKNYEDILKAPPTRKHWVKDELVFKCSIPSCTKLFNFFERRHHCRKCGGIYCKEHTSHYLYINHLAQFTTGGRGTLSKVCDLCISEYNDFIQHEFGVSISNSNRTTPVPAAEPQQAPEPAPKLEYRPTDINKPKVPFEKKDRADQLVGSVPANWSWSSF